MENLKSTLFVILMLVLIVSAGVWSFSTIESGSAHVNNQIQKDLENKNKDLENKVADLNNQIELLQTQVAKDTTNANDVTVQDQTQTQPVKTTTTPSTTTIKPATLKYQSLINDVQKLIDGNITMKKGSKGIAVGTVQKFLNIYNNTSNKVDNDYGASTVTAISSFQKSQSLTADGQVASSTLLKMIDWLKKQ